MGLPKSVVIYEVGPREGFQIEDGLISTNDKVKLVNGLSETGLTSIEVTSFVSPKWVPQMADAEEVLSQIKRKEGVSYRTVYLNIKGLHRAYQNSVTLDGVLMLTASNTFSKRNTNKDIKETLSTIPSWIQAYKEYKIPVEQIAVMAAFGCNFEGDIEQRKILDILRRTVQMAEENGETIQKFKLADTMGWANPQQIKNMIYTIRNEWPQIKILLHLHDTRGLGMANAYAAMEEGVNEFETALGGLGGCPFAAVKGAAGNIATEDFVFMCMELGIGTGINLDLLIENVSAAEMIVGHSLPGHLLRGGLLRR
ncbi:MULTISPECIES: hydroxymethylglutaryl-CoA lyase [Neobacillus]|uniref:Hydroxymethylglutaryl-CoA lyase n=1 Tax=Neobacillus rhizophilus TaxID=2833579 RepID=A0A942U1X8_9BACI|nr:MULTISPECIES: hydroxymethylglutaryl-CoA lyase [Neobacillus]MBS4211715.1 hydroxymethylglutaryl-CoA lyase [Neobacillus rhizophilus]